jgi:hypothetical protein
MNNNKFYDHGVANRIQEDGCKTMETIIGQLPTLVESFEIVENSNDFVIMLTKRSNPQKNKSKLKLIKNKITHEQQ